MNIKHILFDLDGTLLPMRQKDFRQYYLPFLAEAYIAHGIFVDKEDFPRISWAGHEIMVTHQSSRKNREVFWEYMSEQLGRPAAECEEIAITFFKTDFNQAACVARPTPLADRIIKTARSKGIEVYLATNPVFPRCAILNRLQWAGLDASDFRLITSYENCSRCKPDPEFYRGILRTFQLDPCECLMAGNDVEMDLTVRILGVRTFLVTDMIENRKNLPIISDYSGSLENLYQFIDSI